MISADVRPRNVFLFTTKRWVRSSMEIVKRAGIVSKTSAQLARDPGPLVRSISCRIRPYCMAKALGLHDDTEGNVAADSQS
jgi:hypothetical protein